MLHSESRKGGTQSHRSIIILASIFLALNISACKQNPNAEQEEAARKLEQLYQDHKLDAQQHLDIILADSHDSIYADRMTRKYYNEGGAWRWMGAPDQIAICDALDSVMHSQIQAIGFSEEAFHMADIDSTLKEMHQPDSVQDLALKMAQLENNLTKTYLKYVVGQRYGFSTPNKLFGPSQYAIEIEQADSAFVDLAMRQLANKENMLEFLNTVEPKDNAYQALKQQLANDSTSEAKNRTLCNMERLRWRDKKHAKDNERYIFVNVAAQEVWTIGPDSVNNMRICCGKASTKTPLLSSEIHRIDVNPEWGIPQSIIRGEVSRHAGDSSYFARRNYYITNASGQHVNPGHLSPSDLASGRYAVRQRSGAGNSLGRIIFRFQNKFSVYLHDTSSPRAFYNQQRTVSHGCVRLQRPFEIAEFVLPNADEWMLDQMRLSMDMQPKTEQGRQYKRNHSGAIRLIKNTPVEPKVPVLIDYYTCYPNPKTGVIDTWGDPYSYDKIVLKAIKPFLP
ncbi:MAG: L,D-transpeptidase family protein [Prevotella sp.]|nr:L,D-transpeptidase family protein [Prevotella sp.]